MPTKIKALGRRMAAYAKDPILANSFWLMVNTLILTGLGFFFWTVVARTYTPRDVGLASALISTMNLVVQISGLGLGIALVRYLPHVKDPDRSINSTMLISLIVGIAFSAISIYLIGAFSPHLAFVQRNLFWGLLFIVGVGSSICFLYFDNVFLSYNRSQYTAFKSFVFSIIKIIAPPFLVSLGVAGIFGSWVVGTIAGLIIAIAVLVKQKLYRPKLEIYEAIIQEWLPFSFGNYVATLVRMLPGLVFPILITEAIKPESAAYYYTAYMVAGLLHIIPNATSSALFAEGSRGDAAYKSAQKKAYLVTYALLIPSAILLYILAPFLLGFLGPSYASEGTGILRIFTLGSLIVAINHFYGTRLNIEHRIKALIVRNIAIVGVTFASWFLFFHTMGLEGVGWSWLVGLCAILPFMAFERFTRN